jgi:cyclopropane fatty-acyl-phospholipid synthase-like methyltransferase
MTTDFFAHKAGSYEQNRNRVDNVDNIAKKILSTIRLEPTMHLMDFGSGTGLLLERIAPHVGKITAVDVSDSMNSQLSQKRAMLGCAIEIIEVDLEQLDMAKKFDGIVSSMTLHHIRDIESLFRKFHRMLDVGGFIAVADLDKEDGGFHTADTGVFHAGFDRGEIVKIAARVGFRDVEIASASVVHKPQGDYPVFLLTAIR